METFCTGYDKYYNFQILKRVLPLLLSTAGCKELEMSENSLKLSSHDSVGAKGMGILKFDELGFIVVFECQPL